MIKIEINLLKNRKLLIPVIALSLVILFLAFVDYWIASGQKQLAGNALAEFVATRATQSGILLLFFLIWMQQSTISLHNHGFYRMLLSFGWSRQKLYSYILFQLAIYSVLLMLLNFICYSVLSLFYRTNPFALVIQTDFNAIVSQFIFLFVSGSIGVLIGFLQPSYAMILPVIIYWLFEGWIVSLVRRKFETEISAYLPFGSLRQIIGESFLTSLETIVITVYITIIFLLLHISLQKRMFL